MVPVVYAEAFTETVIVLVEDVPVKPAGKVHR
jgi:hypothetical protein